jgi:hypothetical protein
MQRNQDWLVPLLSGVGAMASSPSRYFGSALLQGLAGGAQQYASMQNKAEEQMIKRGELDVARANATSTAGQVDTARAQEERGRQALAAAIAAGAYIANNNTFRVYPDGRNPTIVRADEFYRRITEGRPFPLTPYGSPEGTAAATGTAAPNAPTVTRTDLPPPPRPDAAQPPASQPGAAQPGATPPETTDQAGGTPPQPQLITVPTRIDQAIPQDMLPRLQEIATSIINTGGTSVNFAPTNQNPYPEAAATARVAQESLLQRNTLAAELAKLPTSGLLTPGALQPFFARTVGTINSILSSVGSEERILERELGTSESTQKIGREMALAIQRGQGSRALGELTAALATVPTTANSPEGAANILADIYVSQQRAIDMNNFYIRSHQQLRNMGITDEKQMSYANQQLANEFAERQNAIYGRERENLQKMFMQTIRNPQTGQTMRLVPYIVDHADSMSPEFRRNIESFFGPGILRYFTGR